MALQKQLMFLLVALAVSACATMGPRTDTGTPPSEAAAAAPQPADQDQDATPQAREEAQAGDDDNADDTADAAATTPAAAPQPAAPVPPATIWPRLRAGFGLDPSDNARVDAQARWYGEHTRYLERVFSRANPYLYLILQQVEKRHMPSEIALLPVVESAFRPFAYSHGRAAGLWQFIPGTGRRFGLKQNWWYDGRRDVLASTNAALDYLQQLHDDCNNDWLLALAAYNSGEGTVLAAIRHNERHGRPTDFWHLDLPQETRDYVPKLLGLREVIADPQAYDLALTAIPNHPQLKEVDTGGQIDLALAADLAGVSLEDIYRLNPGFNRWATDPDGPNHLLLPIAAADRFSTALADLPKSKRVKWARHEVGRGETLIQIADRYHTTVALLQEVNGLRSHTIRAGHYLVIPVAKRRLDQYALSADQRRQHLLEARRSGHKLVHVVQSGDTLWDLARHYRVNLRQLAAWNGMAPRDSLRPGRKLVVWVHVRHSRHRAGASVSVLAGGPPMSTVQSLQYRVRRGDSLSSISERFRVSVHDLRRWNDLHKGGYLQPGQKLQLYVDVTHLSDNS